MSVDQPKSTEVLRVVIFREPAEVIITVRLGNTVDLVSSGAPTRKILDAQQ